VIKYDETKNPYINQPLGDNHCEGWQEGFERCAVESMQKINYLNRKIEYLLDKISDAKVCPDGYGPSDTCPEECQTCWGEAMEREIDKNENLR